MSGIRKTPIIRFCIDIFILLSAGISLLVVHILVKPFFRGFFCDDLSIQHPYKEDTVPMPMCAAVGVTITVVSFLIIECSLSFGCKKTRDSRLISVSWTIAKLIAIFAFGIGTTLILTEAGKLSLGRLRPNFLDVCKPNMTAINCSRFVENFVCTNMNLKEKVILDSRKSFPSGHASFVAFVAGFVSFYYQKRLNFEYSVLLKTFLQVLVSLLALFTMCSRVSDYKHHWSDILGGCVLGIAVAFWTICCLGSQVELEMQPPYQQKRPLTLSPTLETQMTLSDPCTPEPAAFLSPRFNEV